MTVLILIGLITIFFSPSSLFPQHDKQDYKLSYFFYNCVEAGFSGKVTFVIFNYFLYDDPSTKLNVDILVCCNKYGKIIYMLKAIEKKGGIHWSKIKIPPAELPIIEIMQEAVRNTRRAIEKLEKESLEKENQQNFLFNNKSSIQALRGLFFIPIQIDQLTNFCHN